MTTDQTVAFRLQLRSAGFDPVGCIGKRPVETGWQQMVGLSEAEILVMPGANTGFNCRNTPALDADITDEDAVEAVELAVREWCEDRGRVLVRIGKSPKRLIPFRTEAPFAKLSATFLAPNGETQRIEILGDGQQALCHGTHPDTGADYTWHGGCLGEVTRDELPELSGQEAHKLLDYLSDMLMEQFGYERTQAAGGGGGNGLDPEAPATRGPVDVEAELQSMVDGQTVNAAQCRIIPKKLGAGEHPDSVLTFIVDETMARVGLSLSWTHEKEVVFVRRRILAAYNNKLLEDYTPGMGVPYWLPGEFHQRWLDVIGEGGTPMFHYAGKFCVRARQGSKPGDTRAAHQAGAPQPGKASKGTLVLRPFEPIDEASLPPRRFMYGKHYQRGTVGITAGPGGMGKSSLDMVEAIAMVLAKNLLGEQPTEMVRVWYHNGEDPREEIDRRLVAICKYYGIRQDELRGGLFTTSGEEFPLKVAKGYSNLEIDNALMKRIDDVINTEQIGLAIFDPLVTMHSVPEVDPGKMDAVIRLFAGIGMDNAAAVELAHHMRKPAAGVAADYDIHDIRGVAAITDAVRAARILNRMNEKAAEEAGCTEFERLDRFRVDRAKGNYSRASDHAATWREFTNVSLLNGDDVGVVTPWEFPGQGAQTPEKDAADLKADHVFLQLLSKFLDRGVNVSASIGPNYAPAKFVEEQEAKTAKVSKAALKASMSRMLDDTRIVSEQVGRSDRNAHRLVRGKK